MAPLQAIMNDRERNALPVCLTEVKQTVVKICKEAE